MYVTLLHKDDSIKTGKGSLCFAILENWWKTVHRRVYIDTKASTGMWQPSNTLLDFDRVLSLAIVHCLCGSVTSLNQAAMVHSNYRVFIRIILKRTKYSLFSEKWSSNWISISDLEFNFSNFSWTWVIYSSEF